MSQQTPGPTPPLLSIGTNDDADLDAVLQPRPWWRRRGPIIGIAVFLLIVLIGGIAFALLRRPRAVTYQFSQVTQGNLALTISATGPLQSGVYDVNFTGSGKIQSIDVSVGQTVKKGQVLAQLDPTSLQDAVNQAQAAVQSAETSLQNSQNSLSATQNETQASVAAAQTTLQNDQTALTNTLKQSQASIAAAQTTLQNDQTALANTQTQEQAAISAAQTTLSNDQTALTNTQQQQQAAINAAQTTLNNDQTALNNTLALSNAQLQSAANSYEQACGTLATTPPSQPPSTAPAACQSAWYSYQQTVASTNAANGQAQAKVNADQQALNQAQANANAAIAAAQAKVTADQKALQQTQATANATIAQAQAKVTADQQALQQAQVTANANNAAAQARVTADQKALAQAEANANGTNTTSQGTVSSQQAALQTALVQLQTAEDNLKQATLTAPHDGVVTVINGTVGGTPGVSAGSTGGTASGGTFIQIVDTSSLQVVADVNEADMANLKIGDPATFTVNAYGSQVFSGTVSSISPNGQTVSNVVTYPVYIDITMNNLQGAKLLPGMTANTTITVVSLSNVLLLPVNAINFARLAATASTSTGGRQLISAQQAFQATAAARQMLIQLEEQNPHIALESPTPAYVLEQSGKQLVVKPVVLGYTDGTVYQVLSGLSNGETVILGSTTSSRSGLFG